jgi:rubrerythrin
LGGNGGAWWVVAALDRRNGKAGRSNMSVQTPEFDLDRYVRVADRLDLSDIPWDRARDVPLTSGEIRCLRYMMDIESYTVIFLRDVLATPAALDPDVTAFLSCWNYEEYWHGEAFSRLLGEAGVPVAPDGEEVRHDSPYPSRHARSQWIRRRMGTRGYLSHMATLFGSAVASQDFVGVHMTWGAVNELTTLTAYHRMIAKTENSTLVRLLQTIIKQERRHFAFYRAQARMRLARSARARRLVRWSLERLWAPVGTGIRPQAETDFVVNYLFNDPDGVVALGEMDGTIAELPGLEGTRYLTDAAGEAVGRMRLPLAAASSTG